MKVRHLKAGHRGWALAGAVALTVTGAVVIPQLTQASGGPKTYTAASTPTSLIGGIVTPVTVRLANTNANTIDFEAVNVKVPAGLTVTGSPVMSSPMHRGTVSYNSATRTIEMRSLDVDPGQTLAVTLSVSSCTAGTYTWVSDVRQSNSFNGTLNKFNLSGSDASTPITAANTCRLAFTKQPADTFPTATITDTKYAGSPSSPVTVAAVAGDGVTPLGAWSTPISLSATGGAAGATLSGGTAVGQSGGVATFAPSIDKGSDTPYQLVASSTGITGATSNAFTVQYKIQVNCTITTVDDCKTPELPNPDGGTAQVTVNDGNTIDGTLNLIWNPNDNEPLPDCPNYDEMQDAVYFNVVPTNPSQSLAGVTKTVVIKIPIAAGSTTKNDAFEHQICFRAPYAFPGFDIANLLQVVSSSNAGSFAGNTADLAAGSGAPGDSANRWQGLLFSCDLVGPADPCVVSRVITTPPTASTAGLATVVLRVPAADPWAR